MSLKALLEEKRAAILDRWVELVLGSYPKDTAVFLRKQRDRFANPVGHAIHTGLSGMLDGLLSGEDPERLRPHLDDIVRIRAVQRLGPARSLGFLFQLKDAVRAELGAQAVEPAYAEALYELDRWVDALGLLGFEVFLACREQIYELRITEIRNRTMDVKEKLLRQRGQWQGPPEESLLLFPDGEPGQPAPDVALLEMNGPGGAGRGATAAPRSEGAEGAVGARGAADAADTKTTNKPTAE